MSPSITEEHPSRAISYIKDSLEIRLVDVSSDDPNQKANVVQLAPLNTSTEHNPLEAQKLHSSRARTRRTLDSFSLEGKVCVVTGGASGIGLEICRAILASGGQVAIIDLNSTLAQQEAKALAAEYENIHDEEPPLITAHSADVSSPPSVDHAILSILASHPTIDHLVTSAGICENHPAISYPATRMQKLWSVNVEGTFYVAAAVARHLMQRGASGASMVFIGSMSGSVVNVPQAQTPYNASKAAVRQMASSLAVEWAGWGVRVNCVSPGYVRTRLTEEIIRNDPALYEEWVARTPLGKLGRPADVAGAVVYLLSDASSFMTGGEMLIDGGYSAI